MDAKCAEPDGACPDTLESHVDRPFSFGVEGPIQTDIHTSML